MILNVSFFGFEIRKLALLPIFFIVVAVSALFGFHLPIKVRH
jgi:hypothetical protein